jgi:hypothetical protein
MALQDFDLNDCITVILALAVGLIVTALLPSLLGGSTYLVCQLSIRQQHRFCILQRHVDRSAQHLDKIEEERELRRFTEYAFEWRAPGCGLWGCPEVYRRRPVVLERSCWVFAQRYGGDADERDLLDVMGLGQGRSTGGYEYLERRGAAHQWETEELQRWFRHSGQESESKSEPEPEERQADDEHALGSRVVRNVAAERSRGIGEAVSPRNCGVDPSVHGFRKRLSSLDSDEVSLDKNSLQSAAIAESMSGSTLCGGTNEGCSNKFPPLRQRHGVPRSSGRPDYHFEYWHHNDDDDPDPTAPHPRWPVVEEINVRHDIDIESTPIDNRTGPVLSGHDGARE